MPMQIELTAALYRQDAISKLTSQLRIRYLVNASFHVTGRLSSFLAEPKSNFSYKDIKLAPFYMQSTLFSSVLFEFIIF